MLWPTGGCASVRIILERVFECWRVRRPATGIARGDQQGAVPIQRRAGTWGCVCGGRLFRGARRLFPMVLSPLRLRLYAAHDRAARGTPDMDGSDPPIFGPGSGAGPSRLCTRRPAPRGGSLPSKSIPSGKATRPTEHAVGRLSGPTTVAMRMTIPID